MDRRRCDADPDTTFHFDADSHPDPDYSKFYACWNILNLFIFFAAIPGYTFFYLSCQCHSIGVILSGMTVFWTKYFKFSQKFLIFLYIWLKWIRIRQNDSDPTGSRSTTLLYSMPDLDRQ